MIAIIRIVTSITGIFSFITLLIIYALAFLSRNNKNIDKLLNKIAEKHPILCLFSAYWWIIAAIIDFILRKFLL